MEKIVETRLCYSGSPEKLMLLVTDAIKEMQYKDQKAEIQYACSRSSFGNETFTAFLIGRKEVDK